MRHIQNVAIDLFRERGFDNVKVEEIATAAEISPSSIYRYFGTKEGLVLHDEFDAQIMETFASALQGGNSFAGALVATLCATAEDYVVHERDSTVFRLELWTQHSGIKAAGALYLLETIEQVATILAEHSDYSPAEARVISSATTNGFIVAIQTWQLDGASGSAEQYVIDGIAALGQALGALELK